MANNKYGWLLLLLPSTATSGAGESWQDRVLQDVDGQEKHVLLCLQEYLTQMCSWRRCLGDAAV
jgi:hypothetical protein